MKWMNHNQQHRVRHPRRPLRRWTKEENLLLGTMPDVELARRLQRGITGIKQQRLKLGISFYLSAPELVRLLGHQGQKVNGYRQRAKRLRAANSYQKWEDAMLGKMPDREAARKTGRTIKGIQSRRVLLGIPAVRVQPQPMRPWTADEIKLFGTMSDLQLARQLGREKHQVLKQRLALKIPSCHRRQPRRSWKPAEIRLLGRYTDLAVAQRLGCPQNIVRIKRVKLGLPARHPQPRYQRWTPAEDKLLGTGSDPKIARQLNRTRQSVIHRRLRLNISPWRPD
jgi:hypothetical protein